MQYSTFPKTNERVSKLGYGAMGLAGWFEKRPLAEMERSLFGALERGVNFIDTARAYGDSEKIIGGVLRQWTGPAPFVATKVESLGPDNTRWGIPQDVATTFPPGHIRRSAETSLRTLGVDRLDLLQLHLYWPTWGTEGYWMDELQELRAEGKVRSIGISNPDQRCDTALPLVQSGLIDSVQTIFNIFDPTPLDALIPIARQHGVAILARCILDEGGLSGFLRPETTFADDDYRKTFFNCVPRRMYIERVERLREYLPDYADSLVGLAIKFVTHHPGVTTALTSMHVEEYARQNIAVLDEPPLPEAVFQEIRKFHRWVRNFYDNKCWDRDAVGGANS